MAVSGEEIYGGNFVLFDGVPPDLHEHIYKTTFNLGDAFLYFDLLEVLDKKHKASNVAGAMYIMAFISFCTTLRKLTDRKSACNFRRLVKGVYSCAPQKDRLKNIEKIYSSYRTLIDEVIVHQGKGKVTGPRVFPDKKQGSKDLNYLAKLLEEIAQKTCQKYLRPQKNHSALISEFEKVLGK